MRAPFVIAALCALLVPVSALADTTISASSTSSGIKGTLYLDYNTQYCSYSHTTKYQLVWNRTDWDRLNTSWTVGSAVVQQRAYGTKCGNVFSTNSQSWDVTPNSLWGNTGNKTHAQGQTRYVSWPYVGYPFIPVGSSWIGAHLVFYGTSYYGKGPAVCVAANVQDWPC